MKRNLLKFTLALSASLLSACSGAEGLLNQINLSTLNDARFSSAINPSAQRQRVKVVFYNRLTSDRLVPLVPDALESLRFNGQFSLDAANFPRNKGLEQTFPFIEAGNHVIELSFQNQQPIEVPIVVPKSTAAETVIMVILAFDSSGELVKDVQVGYDMNNDRKLDQEMNIYRSSNGQSYLIYSPDGRLIEWISPLLKTDQENVPVDAEAPLPANNPDQGQGSVGNQAPLPQGRDKSPPVPLDVPKIPVPKPLPLPAPAP